jgi:predicted AlkP superfamily phosphohydrolase/phosphomutase
VRQASSREVRLHGAVRGVRSLARHGALWPLAPYLGRAARRLVVERDPRRRSLLLGHLKQEAAFQLFLAFRERRRPPVSTFVTFIADWISHRYWRYHEPALFPGTDAADARALGSAVEDAYRAVDGFLGRVVSRLPEDTVVALVSEHGMAPETRPAEIGPWQYTISGPFLRELVGLPPTVDVRPIARWLAIRPPDGGALPTDCADRIRAVRVAPRGESLFQVYAHRDEVIVKYDLARAVNGADSDLGRLRLRWNDHELPFSALAVRANPQRSAMHAESGVLILSGPTIRRNEEIQGASIVDFAPTLLQAIGTTFPDVPFDGQPLDVFVRR